MFFCSTTPLQVALQMGLRTTYSVFLKATPKEYLLLLQETDNQCEGFSSRLETTLPSKMSILMDSTPREDPGDDVKSDLANWMKMGAERKICGWNLLHYAAAANAWDIMRTLLDEGKVDPNLKDDDGFTALHITAKRGDKKGVRILLANEKTDPNLLNKEMKTPLYIAARRRQEDIVEMLAKHRQMDPNVKGDRDWTVLHLAAQNNMLDVAKILLENPKTDVNIREEHEWTPAHLAAQVRETQPSLNVYYMPFPSARLQQDDRDIDGRKKL